MTPAAALGITVPYTLVVAAGELDMINLADERGGSSPVTPPKFARTSFALRDRSRFRPITADLCIAAGRQLSLRYSGHQIKSSSRRPMVVPCAALRGALATSLSAVLCRGVTPAQ